MSQTKEKKPFVIEFKNNYGTTINTMPTTKAKTSGSSSTIYCLHGQPQVKLRGHCHRQRTDGVDVTARKKLIIASILCLVFMVAEIVGGVLSNSLAIATDAAHLLTDFASFMISLFAIWIAGRPSTQRMSFGWYRAEVIGAVASVFMIWVITAILIWLAVQRIIHQDFEVDAKMMLIIAGLAIFVNFVMGFQLHGHGHSHGGKTSKTATTVTTKGDSKKNSRKNSNSAEAADATNTSTATTPNDVARISGGLAPTESEEDKDNNKTTTIESISSSNGQALRNISATATTVGGGPVTFAADNTGDQQSTSQAMYLAAASVAPPIENLNVRAAFIHVLGDAIQAVGVFIAALVIYFKPEWAIADPICTFVFSIIVLYTTFGIMKDAILVLMEGTPSYLQYAEVMQIFLGIDGVERVHNLRMWALSVNKIALAVHLAIRPGTNPQKILQEASNAVHIKYHFFETTIQIEDFTPEMEDCQQCNAPKIDR